MDAAWQRRRRDQRAAPGRDEDVDLMNRDHLTDPIEIAILVVGLEVAAVDPCLGGASIVDALLGHADEDVERGIGRPHQTRSEEHTSELQSLMRISYAVFCLKKNKQTNIY